MVEEKVIVRIKKMLAMAKGNHAGGEEERDTAMKMVLKLLAKHNLSLTSIEGSVASKDENRVQEDIVLRDEPWSRTIANAVAKLYFSSLYTTKYGKEMRFTFIGLESNVQTAKEMAAYLIDSVSKESRRETSKRNEGSNFKTSFRKGAAQRIYERCIQLKKQAEDESAEEAKSNAATSAGSSTGTALVLASVYQTEERANELMIQQLGVKLVYKTPKTRGATSTGLNAGRAYGDRVGLNKQVK